MKVLVMGATGGSGQAAVKQLLAAGQEVTAFARRPGAGAPRLRWAVGDAMSATDVSDAVRGQDAVVVALGIRENPLRVRLFGPARTPIDVRSTGTANVIAAMERHGVRRLVVQTTYGVGATKGRLGFVDALFFALLLKPQIEDTERQEALVTACDRDWVLVQPVHLDDDVDDGAAPMPFHSTGGETGAMRVSRSSLGRLLAEAVTSPTWVKKSVAVSGVPAPSLRALPSR